TGAGGGRLTAVPHDHSVVRPVFRAETEPSDMPYALLSMGYLAALTSFAAANRRALADRPAASDIAGLGLASYAIARIVARDRITLFLRRPFTFDPAAQQPRQDGFRRPVGELVTCPHCLALWVAGGLAMLHVKRP